MIDTDVDTLLETLKQLINFNSSSQISKSPQILKELDQLELLYEELASLRTFLAHSEETRYTVEKVKSLVIRIIDVASEVEDIVDSFLASFVVPNANDPDHDCCLNFDNVMPEIHAIKRDIFEMYNEKIHDVIADLHDRGSTSRMNTSVLPKEDKIVGFDMDAMEIVDRLTGNRKQLDIISIIGMGGLGKTTLAKRAYNDPFVAYHFYIRVWVTVSQTYQKRDLLLGIFASLSLTGEVSQLSTEKLCEVLYKRLKGRRYLVVIDDIWGVEAWDDLNKCLPDDNVGSRVLVTSRLTDIALHIRPDSPPYFLRFLTVEESWDLLHQRVFPEDTTCPKDLKKIGKQIAERCRGLPLAILVISGLLAKKEKTVEWWTQVLDGIGSYIVSDPEQYMNTLALSFDHLPLHLKSCFLYFAAFPEDFEIHVTKLLWLWVAEGFVRKRSAKRAEDYLINLVERSLVIVDQKRSDGGIKVCRIHDLLHDLCVKKAKEEKFLHQIKAYEEPASSPNTSDFGTKHRRVFIRSYVLDYVFSNPSSPGTRSFLYFNLNAYGLTEETVSFLYRAFKHIRVLDFIPVSTPFLPSEIGQLVHLRYLSLQTRALSIPESISRLRNLQTLIVYGMSFPIDFPFSKDSNMASLMHLCIRPSFRSHYPLALLNIQTISMLHLPVGRQPVLESAPNLRKLGCVVSLKWGGSVLFPPLHFLILLEKLKIYIDNDYSCRLPGQARFTCLNSLPQNLRKVTFVNCYLAWTDLSELGRLPNLEILKLLRGAFQGPRWDTNDGEFQKLKYLKIQSPELSQWNTSSDHFPRLEILVLCHCRRLKEIPFCLGEIPSLALIELRWPRSSAADSARRILEEQRSLGNDGLKILFYSRGEDHPRSPFWKPFTDIRFTYSDSSGASSEAGSTSDKESSDDSA